MAVQLSTFLSTHKLCYVIHFSKYFVSASATYRHLWVGEVLVGLHDLVQLAVADVAISALWSVQQLVPSQQVLGLRVGEGLAR